MRFAEEAMTKAMFDTGSPEYFAVPPTDFDGVNRAGRISDTVAGFGSLGGSLGGQAPIGNQLQGVLKTLSIGRV